MLTAEIEVLKISIKGGAKHSNTHYVTQKL
jgi:hypothetical protein